MDNHHARKRQMFKSSDWQNRKEDGTWETRIRNGHNFNKDIRKLGRRMCKVLPWIGIGSSSCSCETVINLFVP
jgi:tripartite-type tricarboxylate transporter receptor subunit TctC